MTDRDSVKQTVRRVETQLTEAGIFFGHGTETALDEAAWLVGHALQIPPDRLDAHLSDAITPGLREEIEAVLAKRIATRKPLAYLLNEAWFAGLKFYVDERVLVPRSLIGEFIQERFAPWLNASRVHRALDLCTGSGCIAVALAQAFPETMIDASDISTGALAVARRNIDTHALSERVRLVPSDLFAALAGQRYDLIVSNPPYVAQTELSGLPAEYRHEPTLGLVSGAEGLDAVTDILSQASGHLEPGGVLVAEVGNSHVMLQRRFPQVPFLWLTHSSGDESVFLLTQKQLLEWQPEFAAGAREKSP